MTSLTSITSLSRALTPSLALLLLSSGAANASNPKNLGEIELCVDLIELNHHYDKCGRKSYDQIVFYEWSDQYRRFHVIAWCLVEEDDARMPMRAPGADHFIVRWPERDCPVGRKITAPLFRETWSHIDPERENKKLLSERYRRSLDVAPKLARSAHGGG